MPFITPQESLSERHYDVFISHTNGASLALNARVADAAPNQTMVDDAEEVLETVLAALRADPSLTVGASRATVFAESYVEPI